MAEPAGIFSAFEPVDVPHAPASAPPKYDFGLDTLGAGWKGGSAGTDWGLHQSAYAGDISDTIRAEARKRGIDTPPYAQYDLTMFDRRVKAAGGNLNALNMFERQIYERSHQFWDRIAQERKKDPAFLKDFPMVFDETSLQAEAKRRREADEAASNEIYAQSTTGGKAAWWLGSFGTAAKDPLSYIPLGGAAKAEATVGQGILKGFFRGAATNAGITLAIEPAVRLDASARGQDRTLKDTAIDVGLSGVFGGLIEGAHGGLEAKFNITPDEKAAAHVVNRDAEIRSASPFHSTPAGDAEHGTRLAATTAALEAGRPVPKFKTQLQAGTSLAGGAERFKAMVDVAEGRTKNPLSSANGYFQFTDKTWLSYYKREIGAQGLSDAEILKKKTDRPTATRLFNALTKDNQAMLRAAGLPDSETNLYMAHFLGPKALRVLRAAPETPVESLLPHEFIAANPRVLKGKTAGEVIAWADRKMGGEGVVPEAPDTPLLSEDQFASEADYREALAQETSFAAPESGPDFILRPEQAAPTERPQTLLRTIAEMGGIRDDESHGLLASRNLQRFVPGVGPMVRKSGLSIDQLGEGLWEKGWFGPPSTTPRPTEDQVLQLVEKATKGDVFHPEVAADAIMTQQRRYSPTEQEARDEITSTINEHLPGVQIPENVMDLAVRLKAEGHDAGSAYMEAAERFAKDYVHTAKVETGNSEYDIPGFDDEPIGTRGRDLQAGEGIGRPESQPADTGGRGPLAGGDEGYPGAESDSERVAQAVAAEVEAEGPHFEDPNGPDAVAQVESVMHDLKAETSLSDMGFDVGTVYYHQTEMANVEPIKREGFDISKPKARASDPEVPDGVFFKPDDRDIGMALNDKGAQIPVHLRLGNSLKVLDREHLKLELIQDDKFRRLHTEAERFDRDQANGFDELEKQWDALSRGKGPDADREAVEAQMDDYLADWKAGNAKRAAAARARATDYLKERGYESVVIENDKGSFGRATKTIVVFGENQIAAADEPGKQVIYNIIREQQGPMGTLADLTAADIPDATEFRIAEEGKEITVADALESIAKDEAAIKALKDCL